MKHAVFPKEYIAFIDISFYVVVEGDKQAINVGSENNSNIKHDKGCCLQYIQDK